jgi:phosphoribosylamine--glycine ligase
MAAGGYPNDYRKGDVISGLPHTEKADSKVFHAGTQKNATGDVMTAGGRVLCVCALGENIKTAQEKAYQEVTKIEWADAYYRTDIGFKAIK